MPLRTPVLAALTWTLVTGGVARAEGGDPEHEAAEEIAGGIVRSVRRAVALGPTLGLFSTYAPSGSELDGGLSFGLELELFRTSIPTPARVREIAREKAQAKLAEIIRDRFGGQRPDPETMQRLTREIVAQVKAEVIAAIGARPRLLERPRLAVPLEASYLFGPADWLARLGLGLGLGPVSVGPTLSVRFGDDTVAQLGAELSIHLLPTRSPRSPVLDVFLRADLELHARDANDDQLSLGVRVLFDLI